MEGQTEFGTCGICGKTAYLDRAVYEYPIKCECCGNKWDNHKEIVRHCKNCKPKPPTSVTLAIAPSGVGDNITHEYLVRRGFKKGEEELYEMHIPPIHAISLMEVDGYWYPTLWEAPELSHQSDSLVSLHRITTVDELEQILLVLEDYGKIVEVWKEES